MADEAAQKGEADKAEEFTTAAETIATRLIEIEREVDDLKALHLDNARAVEQAKAAVEQNSIAVQEKLTERQKLLGQLDQAKMQEQMNTAMAQLSETVGQDVPTFDEVRDKIEARYAKATGMAELSEGTVENRMLEVERATRSTEAHARLDAMREQLGLCAGEPEPAAPRRGALRPRPEARAFGPNDNDGNDGGVGTRRPSSGARMTARRLETLTRRDASSRSGA